MTQHPEEILKKVGPTTLFNMTGKFGKGPALQAMHRAAGIYLLALRDQEGESVDDPQYHQLWGQACGLPSGSSFELLRNVMISCGWLVRPERSSGFYLVLTPKGEKKAAEFALGLKPSGPEIREEPLPGGRS